MRTEINVLGPVEATVGGASVVPPASRPRQVLALLALNVGERVPTTALVEEIWSDRPPRGALGTLQAYVGHLRRQLAAAQDTGPDGGVDVIVSGRSWCLLDLAAEQVDAVRYQRLSATGRRAAEEGDLREASAQLSAALDVWRGPALYGIPRGPHLAIEAMRLEESRLADLDRRIEADLRLGRRGQVHGELSAVPPQAVR